jgi:Holliday junction resolvase RusA-like endonuclease
MITLPIKALSVNSGFQGRRFKTVEYKKYERNVLLLLPQMQVGKAPYKLFIEFGLSSKLQDLDNCIKFLQDCLVKKYGFDDRDIYELHAKKIITKKGEEFIKFRIDELII